MARPLLATGEMERNLQKAELLRRLLQSLVHAKKVRMEKKKEPMEKLRLKSI